MFTLLQIFPKFFLVFFLIISRTNLPFALLMQIVFLRNQVFCTNPVPRAQKMRNEKKTSVLGDLLQNNASPFFSFCPRNPEHLLIYSLGAAVQQFRDF